MAEQAILDKQIAPGDEDSAKRRQIIAGARAVFLAQGFDAASMNDIARAAGVSKGTLYVYFDNKEQLFEAIVEEECDAQAEGIFDLDPDDHDVEAVLKRLGVAYVKFLCRPEKASAVRTVIAIADRMPEIGRKFYEAGPAVRHRAACGLSVGADRRRRARGRGLRSRRRAVHGILPRDAVQADRVQLRAGAEPRADRARGGDCGVDVHRRLSRAASIIGRSHRTGTAGGAGGGFPEPVSGTEYLIFTLLPLQ